MAYQGKLVTVQEQQGNVPNGSGFAITTAAAPDLDATNLVVGEVVQGLDVVEAIAQLPAVKANRGSPFFKCASFTTFRSIPLAYTTQSCWPCWMAMCEQACNNSELH